MESAPLPVFAGLAVATLSLYVFALAVCFQKGKVVFGWLGLAGLVLPVLDWFTIVGAIRLGKPSSPWAGKHYDQEKLERAKHRFSSESAPDPWSLQRIPSAGVVVFMALAVLLMASMAGAIGFLSDKLSDQEQLLAQHGSDLEDSQSSIDDLESNLSGIASTVSDHESEISTLSFDVLGAGITGRSILSRVTAVESDIRSLEYCLSSMQSAYNRHDHSVSSYSYSTGGPSPRAFLLC